MGKAIIIFTNFYPYYKGEEYLETELPITVKFFDKILIIPTMVNSLMELTRTVPKGIEVYKPDVDCSISGKIRMIRKYSKTLLNNKKLRYVMNYECGNSLRKKTYFVYFQSRVMYASERIKSYDFSALDSYDVTIYSYWMHVVASIAMEIRKSVFRNKKVFMICRGHRYDLYADRNMFKYIPDRCNLLKSFTYIFPCSQDGVNYLNTEYPGFEEKIRLKRLGTVDKGLCECKQDEPLLFISCSSVTKVKRLKIIVDLMVGLKKSGYKIKWIHFGDGIEMDKLKKYAINKLNEKDYELRGHVSNQYLMNVYKEITPFAFLNVSISEGVPVSIMEAQSFGIPVIATEVGGIKELIEDGVNGYLINVMCSIEEFKSIVCKLAKMKHKDYIKMCINARKMWECKSNADYLYHEFYTSIEGWDKRGDNTQ